MMRLNDLEMFCHLIASSQIAKFFASFSLWCFAVRYRLRLSDIFHVVSPLLYFCIISILPYLILRAN
jgi:hypothetical protein